MREISAMASNQHPNAPDTRSGNARPPQQPQTSTAITVAPGVEVLSPARVEYLAETYGLQRPQVLVVRNAICVGATDAELEFFLATCKRVNLDPFARQIWFVKRRQKIEDGFGNESWVDVGRPETGIDGYRTIAERTEQYEGQGAMLWCNAKGQWLDVWLDAEPPRAAKATIFRKGFKEPLTHVALFDEFCPKYKNDKVPAMWKKMPANQIAKCAEAGGFRRAFPRDLSGLVTDTEMEHVDTAATGFSAPAVPAQVAAPATKQITEPVAAPTTSVSVQVPAAIETTATEYPRDTSVQGDSTPAGAAMQAANMAIHADGAKLRATLAASEDDIDREMARLLKILDACETRDDIGGTLGGIVAQAKLRRKATKEDAYANAVIDIVEPQLQLRWRELAPVRGRR